MTIDTSLLDLDRSPTKEELRSFFKKHDWSSAKLSDPKNRSAEKKADMNKVRKIMDVEFEKISREKGLGASSIYFENKITVQDDNGEPIVQHQGNPLLELRDNTEDLVSDAVYEIVTKAVRCVPSEKEKKLLPTNRKEVKIIAIYHLEAKVITRSKGRTAVGAAAYMSCSRIKND